MNLNDISKATIAINSETSAECRNKLLKVALSIYQPSTQDRSKVLDKISNDFNISREKITEILGVYLAIIRLFVESTNKEFNAKLMELGFSSDFVENLPLANNREKVFETVLNSRRNDSGKLSSLKWRIDISLANSQLLKKKPTSIILCLQMKDGQKHTINVDIKTFHYLRFNVALLIQNAPALPHIVQTNKNS